MGFKLHVVNILYYLQFKMPHKHDIPFVRKTEFFSLRPLIRVNP